MVFLDVGVVHDHQRLGWRGHRVDMLAQVKNAWMVFAALVAF
jgi:hypothetical protein